MAKKSRRKRPQAHRSKIAAALAEGAEVHAAIEKAGPTNVRGHVLMAADRAVNGSRDVAYGAPGDNFTRIKDLWNTYLECRPPGHRGVIVEHDVAILNILLKVGRLAGNPGHYDSWVDIAGYAACGAEVAVKS